MGIKILLVWYCILRKYAACLGLCNTGANFPKERGRGILNRLIAQEAGCWRFVVPSFMGLMPGRATYLIDKQGIVRYVFTAQIMVKSHIKKALEAIEQLKEA